MEKGGVYCIENTHNQKKYIGGSKLISQRFRQHKHKLRHNVHENPHLQNAWNKYGEKSFVFKILEICSVNIVEQKEQFWIDYFQSCIRENGYNIRPDAHCSIFTKEHRRNISNSLKTYYLSHKSNMFGKHHSFETKKKIAKNNSGKKRSEETKRKISQNNRSGEPEIKQKLSISHLGNRQSCETKLKIGLASKNIWKISKEKEYICCSCGNPYKTHARRTKYCSYRCNRKEYRKRKAYNENI